MKSFLTSLACALSFSAFSQSFLPEEMKCTSEAKSDVVREFVISKINSGRPELNLDGNWMNTDISGDSFQFGFSNECDNDFGIKFLKNDLRNLQIGKAKTIQGELNYMVGDTDTGMEDENGNLIETVTITCIKIK